MCDKDKLAQRFLMATRACALLVDDAVDMSKGVAKNVRNKTITRIPKSFLTLAGFDCSDNSPQSSNRTKFKKGIQAGVGKSGTTFHNLKEYLISEHPPVAILENVKEIFDGEEDETEGDWIIEQLEALGYVVTVIISKATSLGSLAQRIRAYFICILLPRAIAHDASRQVHVRPRTPIVALNYLI